MEPTTCIGANQREPEVPKELAVKPIDANRIELYAARESIPEGMTQLILPHPSGMPSMAITVMIATRTHADRLVGWLRESGYAK